jgi:hypothetical protein
VISSEGTERLEKTLICSGENPFCTSAVWAATTSAWVNRLLTKGSSLLQSLHGSSYFGAKCRDQSERYGHP